MAAPVQTFLSDELAKSFPRARVRFLKASASGRHLVARFTHQRRVYFAKACVDPAASVAAETIALRAAKNLAVPQLVKRSGRWFLAEALSGRPKKSWSHKDVKAVARLLAKLHHLRVPKDLRPLPGGSRIQSTISDGMRAIAELSERGVFAEADTWALILALRKHEKKAVEIAELVDEPHAICHGDVRTDNVLFDGGDAQLLDFENAGRGDPAIDLARTASYERMSRHTFFVFCDAYAEAVKDDAVVDRAIALQPAMAIVLAMHATRFVSDALSGRMQQLDPTKAQKRIPDLADRISHLIERPVRLELRA